MDALLSRLAAGLPISARRFADAARIALLAQFLRFGAVGVSGFCIDTATVYALRFRLGLYGAGMAGYLFAASANWALNRVWTFRGRSRGLAHRQWALFLATNTAGLVLNRGTYAALIATSALCVRYPVIAVAAGAVAGMLVNFTMARQVVFR
ncbi:MAG: GtrA family protein [Alphaproteobacteria bacterium]|nr:GtrA family protein [Alphaproteobacteria bacterium]